jgi:putative heme-binding domain-containing protein
MKISVTMLLTLLLCLSAGAAEPATLPAMEKWADAGLPVKTGLMLWLDTSRQSAAWNAHGKGDLVTGDLMDVWYDASGNGRDFVQGVRASAPKYIGTPAGAAVRFDGDDDHFRCVTPARNVESFTAIFIAGPRTNGGQFRTFLAAQEKGKSDFSSGFNIDLGPMPSVFDSFDFLNVEGRGFIGAKDLLDQAAPFQKLHVFAVTAAVGTDGVKTYLNGKLAGKRDRTPGTIGVDSLTVGARCFTNEPDPPSVRGFLEGDIAEVLLFDRVLANDERASIEAHLTKKYAATDEVLTKASAAAAGEPLKRVEHAPEVQMFLPGFSARPLPLDLTNINNLRYRPDGKLVAMAYDGNVYLLSDTNGDGLEDKADLFWDNKGRITSPIGIALTPPKYPQGQGLFIANKGKLSLVVDTDGDDRADKEIVVAQGWPAAFHQVDGVGAAIDKEGNIFFGIGTPNFADPFLVDKEGKSHYSLNDQRGTIQKVSPDLKQRETVCTGIRFPVGMAFNPAGDLFVTDQEGATWLANGNPFDELLQIEAGRHYGFPPRHPKHLPDVIDEPSVFDYAPQHQSTCGLLFNEPVNGGPTFGPKEWRGDAIVCGSSRGKLYRTKLIKTPAGYVAQNQIIGSLPVLTIDACLSPKGDLIVATHSGAPDWGTGPTGKGRLFKISYDAMPPQPLLCWPSGPREVRIAFDRPLDPAALAGIAKDVSIDFGQYVGAGDRFEVMAPGYAAVKRQMNEPRHKLAVLGMQVTPDGRTLVITTAEQTQAANYAITLPGLSPRGGGEIEQVNAVDLAYDHHGVAAEWQDEKSSQKVSTVLPHADVAVARAFTAGSAEHDALWPLLHTPGKLTLRTSIDMWNALRPAVQPGSRLDHTFPPEKVTVSFQSNVAIELRSSNAAATVSQSASGSHLPSVTFTPVENEPLPLEIVLPTGQTEPSLTVAFSTAEDPRHRALPLRRFLLPWTRVKAQSDAQVVHADILQLKGGDWLRGRGIFFSNEAACFKCHQVWRQGSDLGPDLSNLIHRDYDSVMRDIRQPSAALNPDYLGSVVKLKDGRVLGGIVRSAGEGHVIVRGDAAGEKSPIATSDIAKITPSPISVMPAGIAEALGEEAMRDLLTFLLTEPLQPAVFERKGAPAPRTRAEVEKVLGGGATTAPAANKPFRVLLVAGPKDHGEGEHDYPLWQKRWTTLLGLAEGVTVDTANEWPTAKQWEQADVAVFYSANPAWTAAKGPELDAFIARGRGLVYLHYAVNGRDDVAALADRIGLAWKGGSSRFRHGQIDLTFRDSAHPITRGFDKITFIDESYWQGTGDPKRIHLLADDMEEGKSQPLIWTMEKPNGRVFVSILGHYTWTFDDPLFRILLLRGICWAGDQPADRLSDLATMGARMQN